jgi:tetratricopeptide (TPR) repeat protein
VLKDARMSALLDEAWRAAAEVPDHQRIELQLEIAAAWLAAGDADKARARLEETTAALLADTANPHLIAPVLPRCAAAWGRQGDAARVEALERHAEPMIQGLQSIDRPELWALWGEAWHAAGDQAAASARVVRAIEEAHTLRNPRPRALAGVAIALAWARMEMEDQDITDRIQRLAETFVP